MYPASGKSHRSNHTEGVFPTLTQSGGKLLAAPGARPAGTSSEVLARPPGRVAGTRLAPRSLHRAHGRAGALLGEEERLHAVEDALEPPGEGRLRHGQLRLRR